MTQQIERAAIPPTVRHKLMVAELDHPGLPYGESPDGRMVSINDVVSGLGCGVVCPQCRARLVAKKGQERRHHFAHEAEEGGDGKEGSASCAGAAETMLHKMAKQIIADARGIWLPALVARHGGRAVVVSEPRWFTFDRMEVEAWRDGIRPDIVGHCGDRELAIEVLVTHACGPEKIAFIEQRQLSAIEINLATFRDFLHAGNIEQTVLRGAPRAWLFNAKLAPVLAEMKVETARLAKVAEEAERRRAVWAQENQRRAAEAQRCAREERDLKEAERLRLLAASTRAAYEARERETARETAEWARREAEHQSQKAAKQAVDADALKGALQQHATLMLGAEAAEKWMCQRPRSGAPAPAYITSAEWGYGYWEDLHLHIAAVARAEADSGEARQRLMSLALRKLKSTERAELWVRSRHPRLGMKAPRDACLLPGGLAQCAAVLR